MIIAFAPFSTVKRAPIARSLATTVGNNLASSSGHGGFGCLGWLRHLGGSRRRFCCFWGRGCGWGVCHFCSDVTSSAGRTYRSRSPDNVLGELAEHHRRHGASRFVFTDLKLNSNLEMWRSIIAGMQGAAPGGQWIGAVHVGMEADNAADAREQRAASEVTHVFGVAVAPEGTRVENPAFDVTPNRYVTAIITERGVARAPYVESLRGLV